MARELQLDIVTPQANVWSGPVSQVVVPAWDGELGIYPDHDPLLALLRGGIATVYSPEAEVRYVVGRGFAEISAESVTLLTDSCEPIAAVDKERAAADHAAAEQELGEIDGHSERAETVRARMELAQARLDA